MGSTDLVEKRLSWRRVARIVIAICDARQEVYLQLDEAQERFVFDGRIYYLQHRKCGRSGCRCRSGRDSDMHGPYWYSKFELGVGSRYVGKELPGHVSKARERYKKLGASIEEKAALHRARLAALEKLLKRGALTTKEAAMLKRWGIE